MKKDKIKRMLTVFLLSALFLNIAGCGENKTTVENIENTLKNVENIPEEAEEQEIAEAVEETPEDSYRKELEQAFLEYWKNFLYEPKDPYYGEEEFKYEDVDSLGLADINHDGIPEVKIYASMYQTEWMYTCCNGEVKELASEYWGGYNFYDEGNVFIAIGEGWLEWRMKNDNYSESVYRNYLKFESGETETIAYHVIDKYVDYSDYSSYTEQAWFIGNPYEEDCQEVTEEEWNAYMADYIAIGEEREIENTVKITPEEVLNAFQNYADEMGVDIDLEELLSEYDVAKKFAVNELKGTYCYGDYLECKLNAAQTIAYVDALEQIPETKDDGYGNRTGNLICAFADISGDGIPVLLIGYENNEDDSLGNMVGEMNVWNLENGQAVMYDLNQDLAYCNCGLSIGKYGEESVLCVQDDWTNACGVWTGKVWYQVCEGELKLLHSMQEISDDSNGGFEYIYILDGITQSSENFEDIDEAPWEEQKILSEVGTFSDLCIEGLSKDEMRQCLNRYLTNIE